jgi:sugar phosphate isomerase/epimerase
MKLKMTRRMFTRTTGFLASAAWLMKASAPLFAKTVAPPGHFKLAVISDGLSQDFATALQIIKSYGISWVEIRTVWGKYNTEATPEQIRRLKELLDKYEFRCSQVDSALFKCTLPGSHTLEASHDSYPHAEYPYSQQTELLQRAIDRAHAWGTDKIRIFSFWRVDKPDAIAGQISAEIHKAAEIAKAAGIRLTLENEPACNVATGHELAAMLQALPANVGANWDVGNGLSLGETSYPDGYRTLGRARIWNVHLKGLHCEPKFKNCDETFPDQGEIDLTGQLRDLYKNGYQETLSVECEFKAPGLSQIETTRRAIEGTLKVMAAAGS